MNLVARAVKSSGIGPAIGAATRCVVAVVLTAVMCATMAADPSQYSEAERQLFVRAHLAGMAPPARLHYRYERTGTLEPDSADRATLTLSGQPGALTAAVDYLSDERKLELPAISPVEGNPIILYFLEREVRELKRLTGGAPGFYRNRIRKALAGDAKVHETEVSLDGRLLKGIEIRIDPYVDDPARPRFEKFAERYYVMVLSPDIPGEVYQLKAELPGPAAGGSGRSILHREILTFERQDSGK